MIAVSSLDGRSSFAVTAAEPPPSPMNAGVSTRVAVGVASLSSMATVTPPAGATVRPVEAGTVAVTATVSFASSTSSSTGASSKVPAALSVSAGIVMVNGSTGVKSSCDAVPGPTETATSVASARATSSVAVTVTCRADGEVSPSPTPVLSRLSVTVVAAASSSRIFRIRSSGSVTPTVLSAEPDTVTVLSGSFTALSFARIVTVPELAVSSAGIVRVTPVWAKSPVSALTVSSPLSLPPGTDETVIVVAALDGWLSEAVTVVSPPFSAISSADSARVTVGVASSSSMVTVMDDVVAAMFVRLEKVIAKVSSGSSVESFAMSIETVFEVTPGRNSRLPVAEV